jgi:hypothetical protein
MNIRARHVFRVLFRPGLVVWYDNICDMKYFMQQTTAIRMLHGETLRQVRGGPREPRGALR